MTTPATTIECQVCADDVPATQICECHSCDFVSCHGCVERYTSDSIMLSCMNCRSNWDRVFVSTQMPKKFMKGPYRKMCERATFEQQRASLEDTVSILKHVKDHDAICVEIEKIKDPAIRERVKSRVKPMAPVAPYKVRGFCNGCRAAVPENEECCRKGFDPGTVVRCPGCEADARTDGPEAFCTQCFSLIRDGRAVPAMDELEVAINLDDADRDLVYRSIEGDKRLFNVALSRVKYYPWHLTDLSPSTVKKLK